MDVSKENLYFDIRAEFSDACRQTYDMIWVPFTRARLCRDNHVIYIIWEEPAKRSNYDPMILGGKYLSYWWLNDQTCS